jgi:hypothetical protein
MLCKKKQYNKRNNQAKKLRRIRLKTIIVIIFLSVFNGLFSNIAPDTMKLLPQKGLQNNTCEDARSYYEKGISY